MKRLWSLIALCLLAAPVAAQNIGPAPGATSCSGLSDAGTACTANTGTSGHTLPFLDGANMFSAQQTDQGLTTTSPGWYAQITGDAFPRVRLGLNAADTASVSFGAGASARDLFLERAGAANLRLGTGDAASPVAQTLSVQNVLTGTSNTAGGNLTINGSQGTGTGAGGSILLQTASTGTTGSAQNALVTALTLDTSQIATFANNVVSGGSLQAANTGAIRWGTNRGALSSSAAGVVQLGLGDAASPAAQTLSAQSVSAGTSNTAGADTIVGGSRGTGTGAGGALIFQTAPAGTTGTAQNARVTALTINSAGLATFTGGISFTGTTPTPSGTGSPTMVAGSTDTAGEITSGASATSVIITFAVTKTNAPFCVVTPQTQLLAFAYTISTSAITITQTATSGEKIDYHCTQH